MGPVCPEPIQLPNVQRSGASRRAATLQALVASAVADHNAATNLARRRVGHTHDSRQRLHCAAGGPRSFILDRQLRDRMLREHPSRSSTDYATLSECSEIQTLADMLRLGTAALRSCPAGKER